MHEERYAFFWQTRFVELLRAPTVCQDVHDLLVREPYVVRGLWVALASSATRFNLVLHAPHRVRVGMTGWERGSVCLVRAPYVVRCSFGHAST